MAATITSRARPVCSCATISAGGAAPTRRQWQTLASVWDLCEEGGLAPRHLPSAALASPCLLLGAGQGVLATALYETGLDVVPVDYSEAMACQARARRGIDTVVADATALPFADDSFASVICASGVLQPGAAQQSGGVLCELTRVANTGATIVCAVYEAGSAQRALAEPLGLVQGGDQRVDRIAELWQEPGLQDRRVCDWTGCSPAEAQRRLDLARPWLDGWFALLQRAARRFEGEHPDPVQAVVDCFNWVLPGMSPGQAPPWNGEYAGCELEESRKDDDAEIHLFRLRAI